jgi:hypothetical protein
MGKDYIIKIKGGGGLASQGGRRGPLPSVPGNPNLDRRRINQPVAPFSAWDGGLGNTLPGPFSLTIFFPYSQNIGGFRGRWYRKEDDLFLLSYWSEQPATITGGDWQDVPGSPFAFNGGTVRIVWSRWQEGQPEFFTVEGNGPINGNVQALRNVASTYSFTDTATSTGTGNQILAPSLNVKKNSGYFAVVATSALTSPQPENITSASSQKLDYLARFWDNPQDDVTNVGILLGIAKTTGTVDDLTVNTVQSSNYFLWATDLPFVSTKRPIMGALTLPAYFEAYYPSNVGLKGDLRIDDVVCRFLTYSEDPSPYLSWTLMTLPIVYEGSPVILATKKLTTLTENVPQLSFILKNASTNLEFVASAQDTGNVASISLGARPANELIVTAFFANTDFFPQASAIGLDGFSSEDGINDRLVTSGYSNGGLVEVTAPMDATRDWIALAFKVKPR